MKKYAAFVMAICLFALLLIGSASPVYAYGVDDKFVYEVTERGVYIKGRKTNDCVFPEEFNGFPVIGVAEEAFDNSTIGFSPFVVPDSVWHIDKYAFADSLIYTENFDLPDHGLEISYGAFEKTNFDNDDAVWDNGGLYIDNHLVAVDKNKIEQTFTVREGTLSIGHKVFSSMPNLVTVYLPDSLEWISSYAFYDCELLNLQLPPNLIGIGESAFGFCQNLKISQLPPKLQVIGAGAFNGLKSIQEITIPDTVRIIGNEAFQFCDLVSVKIPEGIEYIGDSAFRSNKRLENIVLPNKNFYLGGKVFEETAFSKDEANWKDNVLFLNNILLASRNLELTEYAVPDGIINIAGKSFAGHAKLKKVSFPSGLQYIGDHAFYFCEQLEKVHLPDSVIWVGDWAFQKCEALNELTLSNQLKHLGKQAFDDCHALYEVVVPDSLTYLNAGTFDLGAAYDMPSPKITIPASVKYMEAGSVGAMDRKKLTIYGYTGSYAEGYAQRGEISFVALDEQKADTTTSKSLIPSGTNTTCKCTGEHNHVTQGGMQTTGKTAENTTKKQTQTTTNAIKQTDSKITSGTTMKQTQKTTVKEANTSTVLDTATEQTQSITTESDGTTTTESVETSETAASTQSSSEVMSTPFDVSGEEEPMDTEQQPLLWIWFVGAFGVAVVAGAGFMLFKMYSKK